MDDRLLLVTLRGTNRLLEHFVGLPDCARAARDGAEFEHTLPTKGFISKSRFSTATKSARLWRASKLPGQLRGPFPRASANSGRFSGGRLSAPTKTPPTDCREGAKKSLSKSPCARARAFSDYVVADTRPVLWPPSAFVRDQRAVRRSQAGLIARRPRIALFVRQSR